MEAKDLLEIKMPDFIEDTKKEKKVKVVKKFEIFKEKPKDFFYQSEKPEKFYDFTYQGPVKLELPRTNHTPSAEFNFNNPNSIPKINLQQNLNARSNRGIQLLKEYASKLILPEEKLNLDDSPLIDYTIHSCLNSS